MNRTQLIFRTLGYYWRTNLAVLLGVAIGTAVISGALIVGDSVRYSLRQMTLDRLAEVDAALSGSRFFREELTGDLEQALSENPDTAGASIAPAIMLTASLQHEMEPSSEGADPEIATAGQVNLIGLDERLWAMLRGEEGNLPDDQSIVINRRLAEQLEANPEDELNLYVNIPQSIPQESLLGERDVDELVVNFPLTVTRIAEPETTLGRFSLQPNQQLPLNAYVRLSRLQEELDLQTVQASPRNPVAKPARVNALLFSFGGDVTVGDKLASAATGSLAQRLQLDDFHMHLRKVPERSYFALESDRMIVERPLSTHAVDVAEKLNLTSSSVLVYLANEIASVSNPERFSMYSIAAGVEFVNEPPFGPFVNSEGQPVDGLKAGEVVINSWLAEDLQVQAGDEISLSYHVVGSRGELPDIRKTFRVAAVLPLDGSVADDRGFTPFVPGITDARTLNDWEQPFPMETDRITERDDEYWEGNEAKPDGYKTTPKLFMPLDEARQLWQSRYGESTSVRVAVNSELGLDGTAEQFEQAFLQNLSPASLGLVVLPVKQQGLAAAQGTQDFTGLFIGFSFFVIAAATVLITLLFRLGIETRVAQTGLYSAIGMSRSSVRNLLLGEGALVAIGGVILGSLLGIGYAQFMIYGLTTWWRGAIGTTFLQTSVQPQSLATGAAIAFVVAIPGMWLGVRQILRVSAKDRLHGISSSQTGTVRTGGGLKLWIGLVCIAAAVLMVLGVMTGLVPRTEAFGGFNWHIVCFFAGGFLSLIGSLLLYVVWLRRYRATTLKGKGLSAAVRLGARNPSRERQRSSITVILVALATFVVVAVASGRQNPSQMEPDFNSGNGGFSIVAESARPVLYDLSTEEGQIKLGLIGTQDEQLRKLLNESKIMPFRVRPGEDASCLNLYQTRLPTILGVPQEMIDRGGFLFADTPSEEPWKLLEGRTADGNVPVLGDMNTLQYSLHKAIGDSVELPKELQAGVDLSVVGSLGGSVFQGVLLMSEANFLELFPDVEGYNYFLIETPMEDVEPLTRELETRLVTLGFDAEPVGRRLESFLAVQNTYLSTFQALGGLGLLLGTFGLAIVMLRNVLERRGELALMRAIGFSRGMIGMLVLIENAVLLTVGLVIGTVTALWAMLPNILSRGSDVPWCSGAVLLLAVFAAGMLGASFAILQAVRMPVLQSLRGE